MRDAERICLGLLALLLASAAGTPAAAQQQKPNILFIMGDGIGWMQPILSIPRKKLDPPSAQTFATIFAMSGRRSVARIIDKWC